MQQLELLLSLLLVMIILVIVARKTGIPYPVLLVVGGLALSFIPGLPKFELQPDVVFLLFLPPLLFSAAWVISWRDFKANLRPILLLAFGLVIFTTSGVALIARLIIPGLSWEVAFVLGAIVSPTDPVTATATARRLGIPGRITTILESESLVNDATGLVIYRVAVAAVVTTSFSIWQAGLQFVVVSVGGVAVGLALAWVVNLVVSRLEDSPTENSLMIMTAYAAYLLADLATFSGILSVVAASLYLSRRNHQLFPSRTRIQATGIWETMDFLLNGLVFILIGLQLHLVLTGLSDHSWSDLLWYATVVSLTVIVVRIIWVYPGTYLPRLLFKRLREREPQPPLRNPTVVAWAGMRGVLSLAAALALPLTINGGQPFPQRNLLIFLTFSVILTTLIIQGLSLPLLVRFLKIPTDDGPMREELKAELAAAKAGKARLAELQGESWLHSQQELVADLEAHYANREQRYGARSDDGKHRKDEAAEQQAAIYARVERELIEAERQAVIQLRDANTIGDEVLANLQSKFDYRVLLAEE